MTVSGRPIEGIHDPRLWSDAKPRIYVAARAIIERRLKALREAVKEHEAALKELGG